MTDLPLRDVILFVAKTLQSPFSPQDLVVACWEARPSSFGLGGYETQYPAVHRVYPRVYGAHGLIALGYLERLSVTELRVTDKGQRTLRTRGSSGSRRRGEQLHAHEREQCRSENDPRPL